MYVTQSNPSREAVNTSAVSADPISGFGSVGMSKEMAGEDVNSATGGMVILRFSIEAAPRAAG